MVGFVILIWRVRPSRRSIVGDQIIRGRLFLLVFFRRSFIWITGQQRFDIFRRVWLLFGRRVSEVGKLVSQGPVIGGVEIIRRRSTKNAFPELAPRQFRGGLRGGGWRRQQQVVNGGDGDLWRCGVIHHGDAEAEKLAPAFGKRVGRQQHATGNALFTGHHGEWQLTNDAQIVEVADQQVCTADSAIILTGGGNDHRFRHIDQIRLIDGKLERNDRRLISQHGNIKGFATPYATAGKLPVDSEGLCLLKEYASLPVTVDGARTKRELAPALAADSKGLEGACRLGDGEGDQAAGMHCGSPLLPGESSLGGRLRRLGLDADHAHRVLGIDGIIDRRRGEACRSQAQADRPLRHGDDTGKGGGRLTDLVEIDAADGIPLSQLQIRRLGRWLGEDDPHRQLLALLKPHVGGHELHDPQWLQLRLMEKDLPETDKLAGQRPRRDRQKRNDHRGGQQEDGRRPPGNADRTACIAFRKHGLEPTRENRARGMPASVGRPCTEPGIIRSRRRGESGSEIVPYRFVQRFKAATTPGATNAHRKPNAKGQPEQQGRPPTEIGAGDGQIEHQHHEKKAGDGHADPPANDEQSQMEDHAPLVLLGSGCSPEGHDIHLAGSSCRRRSMVHSSATTRNAMTARSNSR